MGTLNLFLLVLFIIHFGVTLSLYLKRKRFDYILLMSIFLILITSVLIKMLYPCYAVFNMKASTLLRYSAIFLSVISISKFTFNKIRNSS